MTTIDDLRPCDKCGGPIGFVFHVLRLTQAVVNAHAARERAGLGMMFGGGPGGDRLASVFVPHRDEVKLLADQPDSGGWTEVFLCQECACEGVVPALLVEQRAKALEGKGG